VFSIEKPADSVELSPYPAEVDGRLVGEHPIICFTKRQINRVAQSDLVVMLCGESGTGKEIAARLIHDLSSRADAPFEKINCAAIPSELLEAELFGYSRGAFTGAHSSKPGRISIAGKGTVFLDEIGELLPPLQAKLLQAVEDRNFVPLGSTRPCNVEARILASTNRDLHECMISGAFRSDLYYRLTDVVIEMPPLRCRLSDIPSLVRHFVQLYAHAYNRTPSELDHDQFSSLMHYSWPGNVRELAALVKRSLVLGNREAFAELGKQATHPQRRASDGSVGMASGNGSFVLQERVAKAVQATETRVIRQALQATNWNRKMASKLLQISYRSLLYKIKQYKMSPPVK
jgi:two-component system, NtrC family, response regulator AtoC